MSIGERSSNLMPMRLKHVAPQHYSHTVVPGAEPVSLKEQALQAHRQESKRMDRNRRRRAQAR